jgi:hypothetical protein
VSHFELETRASAQTGTPSRVRLLALLLLAPWLSACGAGGAPSVHVARDLASVAVPGYSARHTNPGEFAADFLRSKNFRSLVIEVDYPAGHPPTPAALELLRERLSERCDKPDGISIVLDDEIPLAEFPPVMGDPELLALEAAHRSFGPDLQQGIASMYLLCVTGSGWNPQNPSEHVAGLSYTGSSAALFLDACDTDGNPWVTTEEVEGTILVHEAGHLIGLVNAGVPMVNPHEDPERPHHDVDPTSLMYYAPAVPFLTPNIGDPDFAQYGAECVRDIQAFGGK